MKYLKKKCFIWMCICMMSAFVGCGMNDTADAHNTEATENVNDVTGKDAYDHEQDTDGNVMEDAVDGIGDGVNDVVDDIENVTDEATDGTTENTTNDSKSHTTDKNDKDTTKK